MGFAELHLHLEGTVDRETVMMLDPSLTREVVDGVWGFTDFGGFLECFKFVARRLRGPDDYALIYDNLGTTIVGAVAKIDVTLIPGGAPPAAAKSRAKSTAPAAPATKVDGLNRPGAKTP